MTEDATAPVPWAAVAGLCLPILALPWGNTDVPGLGSALVAPVALMGIVVAGSHLVARRRPLLVPAPPLAAAVLLLVVEVVASIPARDPTLALRLVVVSVLGLGWAALATAIGTDRRAVGLLVGVLLASGGVLCAAAVPAAARLRSTVGADVVDGRLTGAFGQPNELGAFAAIVVVVGLGVAVTVRRRLWVLGAALATAAATAALLLSLSRGAWIGALVGLLVLAAALPRSRPTLAVVAACAVLVVTGLAVSASKGGTIELIGRRAATVVDPTYDPLDHRPAIWHEAFRQIRAAPLLGQGPGGFLDASTDAGSSVSSDEPSHAHDLVLTATAETGLLGLAAVVLVVVVGVLELLRARRGGPGGTPPPGSELAVAAAAALATVLGEGIVDFPLHNAVLALVVWMMLGVLCAAARSPRPAEAPPVAERPTVRSGSPQESGPTRGAQGDLVAARAGFGTRSGPRSPK